VDYSARSVIVVGPDLKLHQCGLPRALALTLYEPFLIRRLIAQGHARTIRKGRELLHELAFSGPAGAQRPLSRPRSRASPRP